MIVGVLTGIAVSAVIIAFQKHKNLSNVKESALREVEYLEFLTARVSKTAREDYKDAVVRLKKLF